MAKRKTKEQRETEEMAALRQRLDDLFVGAIGNVFYEEGSEPWPEEFMRFARAVKEAFVVRKDDDQAGNEFLWDIWNLEKYKTPESACTFLYQHDVRA